MSIKLVIHRRYLICFLRLPRLVGLFCSSGGGKVDSVRALLVEALEELPNPVDLDVEQLADEWLVR